MKKIIRNSFALGVCALLLGPSYGQASAKENSNLTSEQKNILQQSEEDQSNDLTFDQIDKFTIGQGEQFVMEYLKKNNLNYSIGSPEFIEFLNGLAFEEPDKGVKTEASFDIMDAYANVYLEKLDYAQSVNPDVEMKPFQLDSATKSKTIEETRLENEQKNKEFEEEVEKEYQQEKATNKVTAAASYNRSNARAYMEKYWKSYNKSYRSFSNDCTNYASQVVQAGGMRQEGQSASPGYHSTTKSWYYRSLPSYAYTYSTSWSVVKDFYSYWAGHKGHSHKMFKGHKDPASYTSTGDIIILRDQKTGIWHHTIIDNGRTAAGYVAYSGHTNNHLKKSLYNVDGSKYDFYCIKF
ncbi:amidase domain-containing protein [Priestia koreensis]|uniref:amidase domain-containing protein n=1 Tax=Priestia koreensis TaxID=284581 RepID=UPI00203AA67A|nr:amidase domain-containing protein [Priestia koreensis]MCM3005733.1 amidase domain-containing protein [Priestia koreensis]